MSDFPTAVSVAAAASAWCQESGLEQLESRTLLKHHELELHREEQGETATAIASEADLQLL